MKILHLTLKKKWFDMIASGEKKEEYREIKKHWISRFCDVHKGAIGGDFMDKHKVVSYTFKTFDAIIFRNGYSGGAPLISVKWEGIGSGNPISGLSEEGYLDREVFVIKLGEIIK